MAKAKSDKIILQSLDEYDRTYPIIDPEYNTITREITIPARDKHPANVLQLDPEDFDYLKKTYKLFGSFLDRGINRVLDEIPSNYLSAAAQVANARSEVADVQARLDETKALAEAKDAEIAELKKKLEGYGAKIE